MKTIELENKQYEFPTDWSDLDMNTYIKVCKTLTKFDMERSIQMIISIISDLTEIDHETLKRVPMEQIKPIIDEISFLFNSNPDYSELDKEDPKINIGGHTFKVQDFNKATVDEALFVEQQIRSSENYLHILDILIASMVRPVTSNGEIEEFDASKIEDRKKFFQDHMKVSDIYTISLFFSIQEKSFITDSHWKMKKEDQKKEQDQEQ